MDKDFEQLVGMEITEARLALGWWWVLENQHVTFEGGEYMFYRVGHNPNRVRVFTDGKNIVTKVKTNLWIFG